MLQIGLEFHCAAKVGNGRFRPPLKRVRLDFHREAACVTGMSRKSPSLRPKCDVVGAIIWLVYLKRERQLDLL